jgi:hypothetical protein
MKKLVDSGALRAALGVLVFCASICLVSAAQSSKTVSIHQVPAAVKKTIEDQATGFKLGDIEREETDGELVYTATVNKSGQDRDFTVAEDGRLLSVEVELEETPAAVQKTIKAQVGAGEVDTIERNVEEDAYEVDFIKKDGTDSFFSVTPDGRLSTVQVILGEVPGAVRKTIEANLGKGKLGNLYRLSEDGAVSYDAEVNYEEKQRDLVIAENGKLESVQVSLSETPEPVQKTIKEKIGGGKLIRIDRSFEQKMGVMPYEVEAWKEGKPFNFSVGPRGRFLGMDE